MTPDAIRVAMAELDGYTNIRPVIVDRDKPPIGWFGDVDRITKTQPWIPSYDSLDDCQRVFKGLTEEQKLLVLRHLASDVVPLALYWKELDCRDLIKIAEATPAQWCEAILRTRKLQYPQRFTA